MVDEWAGYIAQVQVIPGIPDGTQLVGLGILLPTMVFAYRLIANANDKSRTEAWQSNARLLEENRRLLEENERLLSRLGRRTGPQGHTNGPQGHTNEK